jgi:hypothetical protein
MRKLRSVERLLDRLGGAELLVVSLVMIGVPALFSALL